MRHIHHITRTGDLDLCQCFPHSQVYNIGFFVLSSLVLLLFFRSLVKVAGKRITGSELVCRRRVSSGISINNRTRVCVTLKMRA